MRLIDADELVLYLEKHVHELRCSEEAQRELLEIFVDEQPTVEIPQWLPISEKLPENEKEVEITYEGKHCLTGDIKRYTARAFYTDGEHNTENSAYYWEETDNLEYDEDKDAYIIPEGWWEATKFGDEFFNVYMKVVAWRPIGEPYKEDNNVKN